MSAGFGSRGSLGGPDSVVSIVAAAGGLLRVPPPKVHLTCEAGILLPASMVGSSPVLLGTSHSTLSYAM